MIVSSISRASPCHPHLNSTSFTRIIRRSKASISINNDNDENENVCMVSNGLSFGPIPYTQGWAWQQTFLHSRLSSQKRQQNATNDVDRVLLFEHKPVYTLGRGADEAYLTFLENDDTMEERRRRLSRKVRGKGTARLSIDRLESLNEGGDIHSAVSDLIQNIIPVSAPNGVPIYRVERGGEVTFHGPGQLVAYPLIYLKREPYKQDLHWYLWSIEEVIIQALKTYDIHGVRDDINTGVWVNEKKIAAIGISSSRWITTHGFAINVSPNLSYFDTSVIIPCGIEGRGVTSIYESLKERGEERSCPSIDEVTKVIMQSFEDVFRVPMKMGDLLKVV